MDIGEIQAATTSGHLERGEEHVYTFVRESSSGYEKVAFVLESRACDPHLAVKVDGHTLVENDDSYLAEDSPLRQSNLEVTGGFR